MKKKSIALALFALLVISVILYTLFAIQPSTRLKAAIAAAEGHYRKFDSEKVMPHEKDSVKKWYQYAVLKNIVHSYNDTNISTEELQFFLKNAQSAFLSECKGNPSSCSPSESLVPYCILKKHEGLASGKSDAQIRGEMPAVFTKALEYWFNYFQKQEITKEELNDLYSYLVAEKNCGDAERTKKIDFMEKILQIDQGNMSPIEKLEVSIAKLKIINKLSNSSEIPDDFQLEEILKKNVCLLPASEELSKEISMCDAYNYYQSRYWCKSGLEQFSASDYELAIKLLQEQPSKLEEIFCQLELLLALKGIVQS